MPERLFKWYQRKRVVNVNANIALAGLIAMALTLIPVRLSRYVLDGDTTMDKLLITLIAGVSDVILDVGLYYLLHWVANHWRPMKPKTELEKRHYEASKPAFIKDATIIQIERAILSPLFYGVALGGKFLLLHYGVEREWALVYGFVAGLILTRTIHTVWGLWSGRFKDHEQREPVGQAGDGAGLSDEKPMRNAS